MARSEALTLLDVILAVHEEAANEQETLATVVHLITSGQVVHLITSGQVRLSDDAITAIRELSAPTNAAA